MRFLKLCVNQLLSARPLPTLPVGNPWHTGGKPWWHSEGTPLVRPEPTDVRPCRRHIVRWNRRTGAHPFGWSHHHERDLFDWKKTAPGFGASVAVTTTSPVGWGLNKRSSKPIASATTSRPLLVRVPARDARAEFRHHAHSTASEPIDRQSGTTVGGNLPGSPTVFDLTACASLMIKSRSSAGRSAMQTESPDDHTHMANSSLSCSSTCVTVMSWAGCIR